MKRFNLITAALLLALGAASANAQTLGFIDDQPQRSDLQGSLQGMVKFAQSHTIDPKGNDAAEQPMLVTERETLLMFVPATTIAQANWAKLRVEVLHGGKVSGQLVLAPPQVFPLSDRPARDHRPDVLYSTKAFTARIPWRWVKAGMSLRFRYENKVGDLAGTGIEFSGASEFVLQHIRVGMLADPLPASVNWMETNTAQAALDYFQKIPVSRMTVGQYQPVKFDRIVLPDGKVYTTASKDTGGVHNGDMREHIANDLVSHGINFANFGIVDSKVAPHYPNHYRQVVAHQAVGRYANGVVRHGLSGGSGLATLHDLTGNEFSHELGHNFGLGHYPGGGRWSSHHATSAWGYDAFRNRMLANLAWSRPASDNVIEGYRTPAFKGVYAFNTDPMAGAEADSALSLYTLHTGYTAKRVQQFFAQSAVVDPASPSGYSRWDASARAMVPDKSKQRPTAFGVPVVTLVGYYDPQGQLPTTIYPALHGNHGQTYNLPHGVSHEGCRLMIRSDKSLQVILLSGRRHSPGLMNKFHVNVRSTPLLREASIACVINGQQKLLHSIDIAQPSQALPPALRVGKEDGFVSAALRLPVLGQVLGKKPFESFNALEAKLADVYGEISEWSYSATGRAGSLYRYDNPYSGRREYFMLKKERYWYFPTNGTSNDAWRFMGYADAHVDWTPEPFRAQRTHGSHLEQKIARYYGVSHLRTWRSPDTSARVGDVFAYHNPYSRKVEYFRLSKPTYWYFPIDGRSRGEWAYLGDQSSMNAAFSKAGEKAFEQAVARWHRQGSVLEWSYDNRGTIGDIYRLKHAGRVDYFALRKPTYWYFPSNQTSNGDWTYLGTY